MAFGISAAAWAAIAVGTTAVATAYSADSQRKGMHQQQDAISASQAEDARKSAEAETGAQVAANAKLADAKRRRRGSALGAGDIGAETLGGAPTVLANGGGAGVAAGRSAIQPVSYSGSALGAGAPVSGGSPRVYGGGGSSPNRLAV